MENRVIAGRYEIVHAAGVGGMGTVFRGIAHGDRGFQRSVAIKRMLPIVAADDDPVVSMFAEEARVVSELSHPNIVQVFDFCAEEDGRAVIVMEWVEGLDLSRLIRSFRENGERTPWPIAVAIVIDVLRALNAAHTRRDVTGARAPILHRDVTPTNVLVSVTGVAKLADFGLARAMDRAQVTPPGVLKGKLAYMAPEYVGGGEATPVTDQYSAAVVLWEALAGHRMRKDDNPVALFASVAKPPPPLSGERDDLPATLEAVVTRGLSLDATARYDTCRDLAHALWQVLHDEEVYVDEVQIGRMVREARKRVGLPLDVPPSDVPPRPDVDELPSPS